MTRNILALILVFSISGLIWSFAISAEGDRLIREYLWVKIKEAENNHSCIFQVGGVKKSFSSLIISNLRIVPKQSNDYELRVEGIRVNFRFFQLLFGKKKVSTIKVFKPMLMIYVKGETKDLSQMGEIFDFEKLEIKNGVLGIFKEMKSQPETVIIKDISGLASVISKGKINLGLSGEISDSGTVSLAGAFDEKKSHLKLDIKFASLPFAHYGRLVKDIDGVDYEGGTFDWNITYSPSESLRLDGIIQLKDCIINAKGTWIDRVNGSIKFSNENRYFEKISCNLGENSFILKGNGSEISQGHSEWQISLSSDSANMPAFFQALGMGKNFPIALSDSALKIDASGRIRDGILESPFLIGDIKTPTLKFAGASDYFNLSDFFANFWFKENIFKFYDISADLLGGKAQGNLMLNPNDQLLPLGGELSFTGINGGEAGPVDGFIEISGDRRKIQLKPVNIEISGLSFDGSGFISGNTGEIVLAGKKGESAKGLLFVENGSFNMDYGFYLPDSQVIVPLKEKGIMAPIECKGSLSFSEGNLKSLGTIRLNGGAVEDLPIKMGLIEYSHSKSALKLGKIKFLFEDSGEIFIGPDGAIVVHNVDISPFTSLPFSGGKLSAKGMGDLEKGDFTGLFTIDSPRLLDRDFSHISGEIIAKNKEISIKDGNIDDLLNFSGTVSDEKQDIFLFSHSIPFQKLWEKAGFSQECPISSQVEIKSSVKGTIFSFELSLNLKLGEGKLMDMPFQRGLILLEYNAEKELLLKEMVIDGEDLNISGHGKIKENGQIDMNFLGEAKELGPFCAYMGIRQGLSAHGKLELALGGSVQDPIVMGRLNVPRLTGFGILAKDLSGSLVYRDGIVQIHSVDGDLMGKKVIVSGSLPTDKEKDMDIGFIIKEAHKGSGLLGEDGEGEVDLHLGGKRYSPELKGNIKVEKGTAQIPFSDQSAENITANISVYQGLADLGEIRGRAFGGDITIGGTFEIKDFFNPMGNFTMNAKGCRINYPEMFPAVPKDTVNYSGKMDLATNASFGQQGVELAGKILLYDGRFMLSGGQKLSPLMPWKGPLNINMELGKNIWVDNDNISMELSGQLMVSAPEDRISISGTLGVNRGNIKWIDKNFEITRGIISFQRLGEAKNLDKTRKKTIELFALDGISADYVYKGPRNTLNLPSMFGAVDEGSGNISISLAAQAQYGSVKVLMGISGNPDDMEIIFSSEPALPYEQLMNLVNTGQAESDGLGTDIVGLLQGGISRKVLGDFERNLGRGLRLDEFRIDRKSFFNDKSDNLNISLGKYLDDSLYVKYERELLYEAESRFGVEIKTGPNLIFQSEINQEDDFKFGLKYKYLF